MIESLKAVDLALFVFLNSLNSNVLNGFMTFASGYLIWIPFLFYILWQANKQLTLRTASLFMLFIFLAIIASDTTASYILKNIFTRLRPCRDLEVKPLIYYFGQRCGGKFGFVSSHAANSFAIIAFSMKALGLRGFQKVLWILPVIIGYSRIYLGVHYPGDILGGSLVGLLWGTILALIFRDSVKEQDENAPKSFS